MPQLRTWLDTSGTPPSDRVGPVLPRVTYSTWNCHFCPTELWHHTELQDTFASALSNEHLPNDGPLWFVPPFAHFCLLLYIGPFCAAGLKQCSFHSASQAPVMTRSTASKDLCQPLQGSQRQQQGAQRREGRPQRQGRAALSPAKYKWGQGDTEWSWEQSWGFPGPPRSQFGCSAGAEPPAVIPPAYHCCHHCHTGCPWGGQAAHRGSQLPQGQQGPVSHLGCHSEPPTPAHPFLGGTTASAYCCHCTPTRGWVKGTSPPPQKTASLQPAPRISQQPKSLWVLGGRSSPSSHIQQWTGGQKGGCRPPAQCWSPPRAMQGNGGGRRTGGCSAPAADERIGSLQQQVPGSGGHLLTSSFFFFSPPCMLLFFFLMLCMQYLCWRTEARLSAVTEFLNLQWLHCVANALRRKETASNK